MLKRLHIFLCFDCENDIIDIRLSSQVFVKIGKISKYCLQLSLVFRRKARELYD